MIRPLWVTGKEGMLGQALEKMCLKKKIPAVFSSRSDCDITDRESVQNFFYEKVTPLSGGADQNPVLINCCAYTDVEKAEIDRETAEAVNGYALENLTGLMGPGHIDILHVSTDYVFDGRKKKAYKPGDRTSPINAYGKSKLIGEKILQQAGPGALIVRTSWLYGPGRPNFVSKIINLLNTKDELRVINDQFGGPTSTDDLAACLLGLAGHKEWPVKVCHFSSSDFCSWYDFAVEIRNQAHALGLIKRMVPVHPVSADEFETVARRPANSALDSSETGQLSGVYPSSWVESLARYLQNIKENGAP